jgi:hypothetical protein
LLSSLLPQLVQTFLEVVSTPVVASVLEAAASEVQVEALVAAE